MNLLLHIQYATLCRVCRGNNYISTLSINLRKLRMYTRCIYVDMYIE